MTISKQNNNIPPVVHLKFEEGEMILKEGDFGISIYHVVDGKVEIFIGSGNREIRLAILKPGEIIGEMIFLTGDTARRTASARALSDTVLEAWHPAKIETEYEEMPYMMKHIANQTVKRLTVMNRMYKELKAVKRKQKEVENYDPWNNHRKFYRKETDIECVYRPVNAANGVKLWGKIKDISMSGLRLESKKENTFSFSHEPGDEFVVNAFLPSGERFDVQIKVVRHVNILSKSYLSQGTTLVNLSRIASQKLGFYLMP